MKKRFLTTCLSLFIGASALAIASCDTSSASGSEGLAYELVDGTYTVTGRGTCEDGIIEIPAKYKGKAVTAIADNAFANDQLIGLITIPDSVTTIGAGAFSGCSNISDVNMGNNVTELGNQAFYSCGWLSNINFSDSLVSIGDYAFYGCRRLKTVDFPDSLTTISTHAFDYCELLEEVKFGTSLEVIGEQAFLSCKRLKAVEIPDGAPTEIKANAFELCSAVEYVTLGNSVTRINANAFLSVSHMKELVIGDSVVSIGDNAFTGCTRIYTVTLGASVVTISDTAFSNCRTIREVCNRSNLNIVAGAESYGRIALNAIDVRGADEPSKITIDDQGVLYMMNGRKKIAVGAALKEYTDIVLPNDVIEIANRAFYNEDFVRSIDTGSGCQVIGESAFQNCYHLEKAVIGQSVKTIGRGAFYRNRVLVTVVLRSKLENGSVGENAFWKYTRKSDGSLEKSAKEFKTLFFEGTSAEWEKTKSVFALTGNGNSNGDLINNPKVTIAFYSETNPTSSGNYWCYVEGKPTLWG